MARSRYVTRNGIVQKMCGWLWILYMYESNLGSSVSALDLSDGSECYIHYKPTLFSKTS